jgi:hypothetical protein
MPLSWNEIRIRAAAFAQRWGNTPFVREKAEAQTFENEFFHIFGVDRKKVALFEHEVHYGDSQTSFFDDDRKGKRGYIDLFWRGCIMIEM